MLNHPVRLESAQTFLTGHDGFAAYGLRTQELGRRRPRKAGWTGSMAGQIVT
jgi:hypothetical protein